MPPAAQPCRRYSVKAVRSQSTVGLSVIHVEFDWGVPIFTARQIVQERLSSLEGTFPAGIRPQLGPISSLMGQIMLVGVSRQAGPGGWTHRSRCTS